MRDTNVLQPL